MKEIIPEIYIFAKPKDELAALIVEWLSGKQFIVLSKVNLVAPRGETPAISLLVVDEFGAAEQAFARSLKGRNRRFIVVMTRNNDNTWRHTRLAMLARAFTCLALPTERQLMSAVWEAFADLQTERLIKLSEQMEVELRRVKEAHRADMLVASVARGVAAFLVVLGLTWLLTLLLPLADGPRASLLILSTIPALLLGYVFGRYRDNYRQRFGEFLRHTFHRSAP